MQLHTRVLLSLQIFYLEHFVAHCLSIYLLSVLFSLALKGSVDGFILGVWTKTEQGLFRWQLGHGFDRLECLLVSLEVGHLLLIVIGLTILL